MSEHSDNFDEAAGLPFSEKIPVDLQANVDLVDLMISMVMEQRRLEIDQKTRHLFEYSDRAFQEILHIL